VQKRESGLREEETHQRRLSLDRTAELETKLIALREGKVSPSPPAMASGIAFLCDEGQTSPKGATKNSSCRVLLPLLVLAASGEVTAILAKRKTKASITRPQLTWVDISTWLPPPHLFSLVIDIARAMFLFHIFPLGFALMELRGSSKWRF
jgi:hypothetical protein